MGKLVSMMLFRYRLCLQEQVLSVICVICKLLHTQIRHHTHQCNLSPSISSTNFKTFCFSILFQYLKLHITNLQIKLVPEVITCVWITHQTEAFNHEENYVEKLFVLKLFVLCIVTVVLWLNWSNWQGKWLYALSSIYTAKGRPVSDCKRG